MVRTFRRQPRAGRMAAVPPLAVLPLILLLLSGCDFWHQTYPDERREANFVAAYNYSLQGAYDDAVAAYHRALDANPNNAAAHWDLGFIYQEKLKDYAVSIYHFRRCQEIKKRRHDKDADDPTIENAIRQNQIQLAIQFASSLGHQQSQSQLDDLKRRNTELEATIQELKLRLGAAQLAANSPAAGTNPAVGSPSPVVPKGTSPTSRAGTDPQGANAGKSSGVSSNPTSIRNTSASPTHRVHVIRSGETLAVIAKKYGVTVAQIQSANRSLDPRRLRPGQSVIIPDSR